MWSQVLEADGRQLIESGAIVCAIAKESTALILVDEVGRDQTLAWMFAVLNTMDVPVQALFDIDVLNPDEPWAKLARQNAVKSVERRLSELADALGGDDYLLRQFTAADILMITVLRFLRHSDLIASFPTVAAYVALNERRPAFQQALEEQRAEYAQNAPASN